MSLTVRHAVHAVPVATHYHHRPELQGKRVVGEINCRAHNDSYTHADPVMVRNHAPGRTVLGYATRCVWW